MKDVYQISDRLFLIDAHDLGRKGRTGTYVLKEEKLTIIETSASPSVPYILKGLKELNLDPKEIEYIIVTHIHLDHAGGAGFMLQYCPNAKVVVHPKGARHLADPSRLIQGARAVYGEQFDELFDPIVPIQEDRLIIKEDGETLTLSEECTLTFYDTPGHAKHHFSIHDSVTNGIFSGDTVGIYYEELKEDGIDLILPSSSPNQFDPDAMLHSTKRFEELGVNSIYFSHFGVCHQPEKVYEAMRKWVPLFVESGKTGLEKAPRDNMKKSVEAVEHELKQHVYSYLAELGIKEGHPVFELLAIDLEVSAMGLVDYFRKKEKELQKNEA